MSTSAPRYDLVVIGAGSAAFAAAIRATESGHRVALVEHGAIGGTCVNVGCVPSKALLRAGELAWAAGHHPFAGLHTTSGPVDLAALVGQKDELVGALRSAKYEDLVAGYGFEIIEGHARFTGPDRIEVNGRRLVAPAYLVAAGASPAVPPIPGLESAGYLTSTTALDLTEVPSRLVVIGANAIGLELGQFFLHLGSKVTFVDVANRVAPFEEPEVSGVLAAHLAGQGATIHTGATVTSVSGSAGHTDVAIEVGGRRAVVPADRVLVATGRRPNTGDMGLDAAGIECDGRGAVIVDGELRTTNPRVFAAGDATGAPQFVYVSAYQGALAAANALDDAHKRVDLSALPRVIFTTPQVASTGFTEAEALAAGHEVEASVLSLAEVPRAIVNRDTAGLVKLVAERPGGRLVGASVVAEGAGDVIQSAVLAILHGMSAAELASTFHPYLTMVESLKLAAQGFTRDVKKLSCCAA